MINKITQYYIDNGLKECSECFGIGCANCNYEGAVPYTEEDALNDKENECIANKEMMNDI